MAESFAELLKTLVAPIAIFITWWLTKRTQDQQKHRETIAAWHQLLIEIMQCQERTRSIAISEVKAPLYRLPTDAYRLQFPRLMIASNMDPEEIDAFQCGAHRRRVRMCGMRLDNFTNVAAPITCEEIERSTYVSCGAPFGRTVKPNL
jgi:hypothetical protein